MREETGRNEVKPSMKIDIRGLVCPYTFVKAKLAVEEMEVGQVLEIVLDYPGAAANIPRSMEEHGQKVLKVDRTGENQWVIFIRKEKD
ncbi:MAG: sulfurtransferase TusA family protein [Nitrospiraceae bacterium]|nr:sulfurtransferase TusA family protein [Nitrospiraceae bacterium]